MRLAAWPRRTRPLILAAVALAGLIAAGLGLLRPADDDFLLYHNRTFGIVRVIDGDTLVVDVADGDKETTTIRLWGVDTPETVHPRRPGAEHFGPEATDFARRLAEGQRVRLELVAGRTRCTLGRVLAYVYLPDGRMLNELILETGHGYADWRFDHPRKQRFLTLEQRAERAKAGLWKDVRPEHMPPWRQKRPPGR